MAKKTLQMHEPPHPGEAIRVLCLEPLGLTVGRAAAGLGVTRKTLSQLLNGHAGISSEMALRLSEAFGGSAESWLQQQAQYDLWRARRNAGDLRVERFHGARQPHDDGPATSARSGT